MAETLSTREKIQESFNIPDMDCVVKQIFTSCDTDNLNQVPATKLIGFIEKFMMDNPLELKELEKELDPSGSNPNISLQVFHAAMKIWTRKVKRKDSGDDSFFCGDSDNASFSDDVNHVSFVNSTPIQLMKHVDSPNVSNVSTYSISENNNSLLEKSFLQEELNQLNQKLQKTTIDLDRFKKQLADAEEENEALHSELDRTKQLLESQKQIKEDLLKMKAEYKLLKEEANLDKEKIQKLEEDLESSNKRCGLLEERMLAVENKRKELENKIERLQSDEESFKKDILRITKNLFEKESEVEDLVQLNEVMTLELQREQELLSTYSNENIVLKQELENIKNKQKSNTSGFSPLPLSEEIRQSLSRQTSSSTTSPTFQECLDEFTSTSPLITPRRLFSNNPRALTPKRILKRTTLHNSTSTPNKLEEYCEDRAQNLPQEREERNYLATIEHLRNEINARNKEIEQLKKGNIKNPQKPENDLWQQLEEIKSEFNVLKDSHSKCLLEKCQQEAVINELSDKFATSQEELKLKNRIIDEQKQNHDCGKIIEKNVYLQRLVDQLNKFQDDYVSVQQKLYNEQEKNAALLKQFANNEGDNNSLKKQIDKQQEQNNCLINELETYKDNNKLLTDKISELQRNICQNDEFNQIKKENSKLLREKEEKDSMIKKLLDELEICKQEEEIKVQQHQDMMKTIKNFENLQSKMQKEKEEITNRLFEKSKSFLDMQEEIDELMEKIKTHEETNAQYVKENNDLSSQLQDKCKDLAVIRQERDELLDKLKFYEESHEQISKEVEEIKSISSEEYKDIFKIEEELSLKTEEIKTLLVDIKDYNEIQTRFDKLNAHKHRIQRHLDENVCELKKLIKKVNLFGGLNNRMRSQYPKVSRKLIRKGENFPLLENQVIQREESINALALEIEYYRASLEKLKQEKDETLSNIEQQGVYNIKLAEQVEALKVQLKKMGDNHDQFVAQTNGETQKIVEFLKSEVERVCTVVYGEETTDSDNVFELLLIMKRLTSNLIEKVKVKNRDSTSSNTSIAVQSNENRPLCFGKLQIKIEKLKGKIDHLEHDLNYKNQLLQTRERDLDDFKRKEQDLQRVIADVNKQKEQLEQQFQNARELVQEQIQNLEFELEDKNATIYELEEEKVRLKESEHCFKQQVVSLEAELESESEKIKEYEKALECSESKIADLETQLDDLNQMKEIEAKALSVFEHEAENLRKEVDMMVQEKCANEKRIHNILFGISEQLMRGTTSVYDNWDDVIGPRCLEDIEDDKPFDNLLEKEIFLLNRQVAITVQVLQSLAHFNRHEFIKTIGVTSLEYNLIPKNQPQFPSQTEDFIEKLNKFGPLSKEDIKDRYDELAVLLSLDYTTSEDRYGGQKLRYDKLLEHFWANFNVITKVLEECSDCVTYEHIKSFRHVVEDVFAASQQLGVLKCETRTYKYWNIVTDKINLLKDSIKSTSEQSPETDSKKIVPKHINRFGRTTIKILMFGGLILMVVIVLLYLHLQCEPVASSDTCLLDWLLEKFITGSRSAVSPFYL